MICKKCDKEMPLVFNYKQGYAKLWYCSPCDYAEQEIPPCDHEYKTMKYVYSPTLINVMTRCIKCNQFLKTHKHSDVDLNQLESQDLDREYPYLERIVEIGKIFGRKLRKLKRDYEKETKIKECNIRTWYDGYLKSNNWKRKRDWVLKNNNYRCESCGARAQNVHHKTYERVGYERADDLMAICRSCHAKEHTKNRDLGIVSHFKVKYVETE